MGLVALIMSLTGPRYLNICFQMAERPEVRLTVMEKNFSLHPPPIYVAHLINEYFFLFFLFSLYRRIRRPEDIRSFFSVPMLTKWPSTPLIIARSSVRYRQNFHCVHKYEYVFIIKVKPTTYAVIKS